MLNAQCSKMSIDACGIFSSARLLMLQLCILIKRHPDKRSRYFQPIILFSLPVFHLQVSLEEILRSLSLFLFFCLQSFMLNSIKWKGREKKEITDQSKWLLLERELLMVKNTVHLLKYIEMGQKEMRNVSPVYFLNHLAFHKAFFMSLLLSGSFFLLFFLFLGRKTFRGSLSSCQNNSVKKTPTIPQQPPGQKDGETSVLMNLLTR